MAQEAGFYGKLPGAGDFVQRRLPHDFVQQWDDDLARAVTASCEQMGTHEWRIAYLSSPPWRFVLPPQICGATAWCGVLGPGTDRTGRCFPMVIASPLEPTIESCAQALERPHWFHAAEQAYRRSQRPPLLSAEEFDEVVVALDGCFSEVAVEPLRSVYAADLSGGPLRLALPAYELLAMEYIRALWTRLRSSEDARCLWWTSGQGRVPATILTTGELPQSPAYCAFIDAGWGAGNWSTIGQYPDLEPWKNVPDHSGIAEPGGPDPREALTRPLQQAQADTAPANMLLNEVTALLAAPVPEIGQGATAAAGRSRSRPETAVLRRPDAGLTLVVADCNRPFGAAASGPIAALDQELALEGSSSGVEDLQQQLLALHSRLRQITAEANCAVVALRLEGAQASLLSIGAAGAWLYRHGQLTALIAQPPAAPPSAAPDGELDDLLFGNAVISSGLGGPFDPSCEQRQHNLTSGDRVLLAVTPQLLQLPPATLVRGLSIAVPEDARAHIAAAAGLGADQEWPLAVVQVG